LGGKGWACAAGLCHAVISDLMGLNLIVNETRRFLCLQLPSVTRRFRS
jgi:hypothetical protein